MVTMTIPTQAPVYFAVPRVRRTGLAAATIQGSGMSAPRMAATTAVAGPNRDGATGDKAFEDPV